MRFFAKQQENRRQTSMSKWLSLCSICSTISMMRAQLYWRPTARH